MRQVVIALCAFALVSSACSNGNALDVTMTQLAPGSECPAGGVKIEVSGKSPQVVCNGTTGTNGTNGTTGADGASGAPSLVSQTPIDVNDTRCPRGGVLVQSGLDNGGDAGVALNGTLEVGEVTASSVVCNGATGAHVGSLVPPSGAAGTDTITVNGGDSDGGVAGGGGSVLLSMNGASNGGHVKLFATGHVDASFSAPVTPAPDLGLHPARVTADTVLTSQASANTTLAAGTLFVQNGELDIASGSESVPATRATSLIISTGIVLTLPASGEGTLSITIERSVRNSGTIRVPVGSSATLSAGDFASEAGSAIVASGVTRVGGSSGSLSLLARGNIILRGTADFAGSAGSFAGEGGTFRVVSYEGVVYNLASINASGGDSDSGTGGAAGTVEIDGVETFNGAAITANGGASTSSSFAGNGGNVQIGRAYGLRVVNNGALTANGGSNACSECSGGNGGQIAFLSSDGSVLSNAPIIARGGPALSGGQGGTLQFNGNVNHSQLSTSGASVWLSGTIDLSGGPSSSLLGGSGGNGGSLLVNRYDVQSGSEIVLFGYSHVFANGGQGRSGGAGGAITLQHQEQEGGGQTGGAVVNTVPLSATGGRGFSGSPGAGGSISLRTHTIGYDGAPWELVINRADLDVSGAPGFGGRLVQPGSGGSIGCFGRAGVTITARLLAVAGELTSTLVAAPPGGHVEVGSGEGPVVISGLVDVTGGRSTGSPGGAGGNVTFTGQVVHTSSTIVAKGGATQSATASGGMGGSVSLFSSAQPTDNTASKPSGIDVSGGQGTISGPYGMVMIDGAPATNDWAH